MLASGVSGYEATHVYRGIRKRSVVQVHSILDNKLTPFKQGMSLPISKDWV